MLRWNTRKVTRKGDRLADEWLGPYTITDMTDKGLCTLGDGKGTDIKRKVNAGQLKPFLTRTETDKDQLDNDPEIAMDSIEESDIDQDVETNIGLQKLTLGPNKKTELRSKTVMDVWIYVSSSKPVLCVVSTHHIGGATVGWFTSCMRALLVSHS